MSERAPEPDPNAEYDANGVEVKKAKGKSRMARRATALFTAATGGNKTRPGRPSAAIPDGAGGMLPATHEDPNVAPEEAAAHVEHEDAHTPLHEMRGAAVEGAVEKKEGWLHKKGEERSNWKKRWFVLSGPFLAYYPAPPKAGQEGGAGCEGGNADEPGDDDTQGQPGGKTTDGTRLGMIPLRGSKVERFFHRSRGYTFRIVHPSRRTFFLSASDDDGKFAWLDALSHASAQTTTLYELTAFYHALGVAMGTPMKQMKKHYRKLALRHHPDKGGDPAKFHRITEAYEVLTSLKALEETEAEEAAKYDVVVAEATLQKGPAGVGLGLHIGARFVGVPREEVIMILGTSGLAEAAGQVLRDDIVRKVNRHNLRTLTFDDVVR